MKEDKKNIFPKDFFIKSRPQVENKETFKDITPINWSKKSLSGKTKVIVYSANKKLQ